MARVFSFDVERTIQAVAYLLRNEPGHRMNYMRLLKLLYLAERECLRDAGISITGSRVIAMERGPVLEDVFACIRGQHVGASQWFKYFRVDRYSLELIENPGVGKLSKFLAEKLDAVAHRYQELDEWEMVALTHELQEWIKNNPGKSSKEIPLADILEALGRAGDLREVCSGAATASEFDRFFSADEAH